MKYIILLLLLTTLLSCTKNAEKEQIISLINTNKKEIGRIDLAPYNIEHLVISTHAYQPKNKNYIYLFAKENQELLKYTLYDNKLESIIKIDESMSILDFYIDDDNQYISFIIDDFEELKIRVFSFEGKILLEKAVAANSNYGYSTVYKHILKDTNILYTATAPIIENYQQNPQYYTKSIASIWNIKNQLIETMNITYPKSYSKYYNGYNFTIDRKIINDSIHAFSFEFNDSIFLYNTNSKITTKHLANSKQKYAYTQVPINDIDKYHNEVISYFAFKSPLYFQMQYLPVHGIYTRFFANNERNICQVFYDKNFKYIGEINNKDHTFFPFEYKDKFISCYIDKQELIVEELDLEIDKQFAIKLAKTNIISTDNFLKDNFDAGVQKFLEKTKLIPTKNDSIIIYQSTHCSSCVKASALDFLKEKDNKNTTIIVFDQSDKEMLANHIFLSPIVLCQDNSLTQEGYYHHMPHLYFWKGDKVTSSPIVKEKEEEENI